MSTTLLASISARRLTVLLGVIAAVLVACHITVWILTFKTNLLNSDLHGHWAYLFDLDTEASFGTWFSAVNLLLAGSFTLMYAHARRTERDPWDRWWWVLGIGLVFMSLDEVVGLHESLNTDLLFTAYVGHWTLAGAAVVGILAVAFLPFLWRLPSRTLILFIASAGIYVAGVIGIEFATISYERAGELRTLAYNLWNALEEGLEMAGVILFLYAFLSYVSGSNGKAGAKVEIGS